MIPSALLPGPKLGLRCQGNWCWEFSSALCWEQQQIKYPVVFVFSALATKKHADRQVRAAVRLQGSRVAARTAEAGPPGRREPRAMTQTTGSCTHSTIGRCAGQGRLRLPDRRARPRRLDVRGPCPSPRGVQSAWLQVLGRRGPECPRPLDRPLTGPAAVPSTGHMSAYGEEAALTEQPSSAPSSDV